MKHEILLRRRRIRMTAAKEAKSTFFYSLKLQTNMKDFKDFKKAIVRFIR
ncbi:MAG: hypothetical protein Q7S16_05495 [bacterium]|nr:hypothetical protein [bacterium]